MQLPPFPLVLQRRIEFSETDAAGLIHFTTYFKLLEAAEAELFRRLQLSLLWQDESGFCGFPRVDCQCKFRKPLHFDSLVTIQIKLEDMDARRLYFAGAFLNESDQCCALGSMTTACVVRKEDNTLQSIPIPDPIFQALTLWKNQDS